MQHDSVAHPMNQPPPFGTVQLVIDGEEIIADLRYLKIRAASSPGADFDLNPGAVLVHIGVTRREKPDLKL